MTSTPKRSVSMWFFVAFVFALVSIGGTIQNNREKAQRRLQQPVQTIGTLISSSRCTIVTHYRNQTPIIWLKYQYSVIHPNPGPYILETARYFDTSKECAAFERSKSSVETIWYEEELPEKASLYETEPDSWIGLYGLIPAVLFVLLGVHDQKSINKTKRELQIKKRDLNRLKRARKS